MILFGKASLSSFFVSLGMGIILGLIYELLFYLKSILTASFLAVKKTMVYKYKFKAVYNEIILNLEKRGADKVGHAFDYLFTVAAGILYLIIQYIAADGEFRAYLLFSLVAFFFLSKALAKKYLTGLFVKLFCIASALVAAPFYPIGRLLLILFGGWKKAESPPEIAD